MITRKDKPMQELMSDLRRYQSEKKQDSELDLSRGTLQNIKNILSDYHIRTFLQNIIDPEFYKKLDYQSMSELYDTTRLLYERVRDVKQEIDLSIFFRQGYNIDIGKLKEKFDKYGLQGKHPKINFKRIEELYRKPPHELATYHAPTQKVIIDPFVCRKYIIALLQMIFDEMDMVVCLIGEEGTGKSTRCSQDMFLIHWLLKEFGIINYQFDIKEIFVNTLDKFMALEDKYFGVPFRILGLDEGNQLNRQEWKEPDVMTFFQRLRRERYNQRIKFICIPVLGEMIQNIVLSRLNFIFNSVNINEVESGTLIKGTYEFYIIPRGERIYSPYHRRELTKEEIKNKLFMAMQHKEYLKGMPKDIMIKKCMCNGVWGFDKEEYVKELKETNRTYTVTKRVSFGYYELFNFFKCQVRAAKLGIKKDDVRYGSFMQVIQRINNFWYDNPDLLAKYEAVYQRKLEEKTVTNASKGIVAVDPEPPKEKMDGNQILAEKLK